MTLETFLDGFSNSTFLSNVLSPSWASSLLCIIADGNPGDLETLGQDGSKVTMVFGLRDKDTRGKSQRLQGRCHRGIA